MKWRKKQTPRKQFNFWIKGANNCKIKPRRGFLPCRKYPNVFVPAVINESGLVVESQNKQMVGFPEKYFNVHSFLSSLFTQVTAAFKLPPLACGNPMRKKQHSYTAVISTWSATAGLHRHTLGAEAVLREAVNNYNYFTDRLMNTMSWNTSSSYYMLRMTLLCVRVCSYSVLKPAETPSHILSTKP